ncbi:putative tyrosinase-like protein tyr-3 [Bulinus truncatus]|nr:putative tyrosinase-like protein tyr-3 [Bulinus truncatus]
MSFKVESYAEIVFPTASNVFNFEIIHGGPHVYVGGSMSVLNTAAFDPVFYLHHAYIDYIFERFRARLRSIGVNPETYPQVNTNALHQANAPTGFQVPQSYGYLEVLARTASYQPVPTCSFFSRSCGDRYLVCQLSTGRCIPTTGGPRKKRSVEEPDQPPKESEPETCDKEPTYGLPYQNDYCEGNTLSGGQVDPSLDIYAPAAYNQTRQYIASQQGNPMTYSRCQHDEPAGQIFVYSHGINYAGYYKESTIVDQKLPVSVSLGFVGVKKPSPGRDGVTKVLLRAHDSCGRVCQVACKDPYTNQFKICSGAVAVTTDKPLMFGYTLDEAVTSVVDYKFDSECPRILGDNVFIMFLCDYRNQYPYVKYKPESN